MDKFQSEQQSSCSIDITVYAKPGIAEDPLHCPIELTGVTPSKTIYINRPLPSSPAAPPSSNS